MGPGPGLVTQFFSRKILARIFLGKKFQPGRKPILLAPKFWVVEILYLRVNSIVNSQEKNENRKRKERAVCLLRAPTNTAVFIRNRANVRLDVPVGDRSRAYLQLSLGCATGGYSRARVVGVYGKGATSEAGS